MGVSPNFNTIMNLYLLSGLGADERVFARLQFPSHWKISHLQWFDPSPNEKIDQYAARMAAHIDGSEPFVLMGLSFGGIIAVEIARIVNPQKLVLLSSVATAAELPPFLRAHKLANIARILPTNMLNKVYPGMHRYTGLTDPIDLQLFDDQVHAASPVFVKWAIVAILKWRQTERHPSLLHIHGANDKVFPLAYTRPHKVLANAGHFMVLTHAEELSKILVEELE